VPVAGFSNRASISACARTSYAARQAESSGGAVGVLAAYGDSSRRSRRSMLHFEPILLQTPAFPPSRARLATLDAL